MKKIRDVIRLKLTTTLSERQIAQALDISRPVVAKYWMGFTRSKLSGEQIDQMADSELISAIEKPRIEKSNKYRQLSQYFPHFVVELQRTGVTKHLLWQEYKVKHREGFQYSQFCYHFQMWHNASEVRMHIKHKAGDKLFVDYAGDKLSYYDRARGKEVMVEVFVAILGASGLTYVEGSVSQEKPEWIGSNERAIHYFGGAAGAVVPDNLLCVATHNEEHF